MEKQEQKNKEYYVVDVLHILKTLWRNVWAIALCGLLAGAIGFSVAAFGIAPTYSSSVKLYVNNNTFSLGNTSVSISASQLTAAQSLVKTYGEILNSRSTMERVAQESGLGYTWKDVQGMIEYAPLNETEIMQVKVTCKDPYHASTIANTIAEVLPIRISEIIDGASMEVVDSAIPNVQKVAPSITNYTALGMILGALAAAAVVVVMALMDDTIHDEEYVLRTYDYPILGKVPNLLDTGSKSYGYYTQKNKKARTERKEGV